MSDNLAGVLVLVAVVLGTAWSEWVDYQRSKAWAEAELHCQERPEAGR